MNGARKLLVFGGIALATLGMLYGLYYAVLVEHQTLDRMGGSLATAFTQAAGRRLPEARTSIDIYAATKFDYVRQVDVHSHWIGLAMLMIVLGVVFDDVALLIGSVIFPLGVILQTTDGGVLASALAIVGSALIIVALAAVAAGFARTST
jgi:hypothetical protein